MVTTLHSEPIAESKATKTLLIDGEIIAKQTMKEALIQNFFTSAKLVGVYADMFVSENHSCLEQDKGVLLESKSNKRQKNLRNSKWC